MMKERIVVFFLFVFGLLKKVFKKYINNILID